MAWIAVASDSDTDWIEGRMTEAGHAPPDPPYCALPGSAFEEADPPTWVDAMLSTVDAALPPMDRLRALLRKEDLLLPLDPPAARVPRTAKVGDLSIVVIGCRIVLALGEAAIVPAFRTRGRSLDQIVDASRVAAMLLGSRGVAQVLAADHLLLEAEANLDMLRAASTVRR